MCIGFMIYKSVRNHHQQPYNHHQAALTVVRAAAGSSCSSIATGSKAPTPVVSYFRARETTCWSFSRSPSAPSPALSMTTSTSPDASAPTAAATESEPRPCSAICGEANETVGEARTSDALCRIAHPWARSVGQARAADLCGKAVERELWVGRRELCDVAFHVVQREEVALEQVEVLVVDRQHRACAEEQRRGALEKSCRAAPTPQRQQGKGGGRGERITDVQVARLVVHRVCH